MCRTEVECGEEQLIGLVKVESKVLRIKTSTYILGGTQFNS